jgi:hypothetical protein
MALALMKTLDWQDGLNICTVPVEVQAAGRKTDEWQPLVAENYT